MNKKYIILVLSLIFCAISTYSHTLDDIPNVHVADRTKYVSNPDGVLSAATVAQLDTLIGGIWKTSTAEVAAVVVKSIGNSDPDSFATALFRKWGIGKKDKNNGVLILVVTDRRKAVIRSGYGAEGVLPDIVCGQIIRNDMAPHFKNGDYDSGMLAAVETMHGIFTTPGAVEELKSKYGNDVRKGDNLFSAYWRIAAIIAVFMLFFAISEVVRRRDPYAAYNRLSQLTVPFAVGACLTLGMGIPALLLILWGAKHCRNKKRVCPNCKSKMRKLSEEEDNQYLTPAQDMEEKINSVDYDVWVCDTCGEVDVFPFFNKNTPYRECPVCHAKAATLVGDRLIRRPTALKEGEGMKTYKCRNCGNTANVPYVIPADDVPVIVPFIGGFGSGRGGGFGGGFGGSFGGGSTGGGGASGGW